jgi:hypothetical protein
MVALPRTSSEVYFPYEAEKTELGKSAKHMAFFFPFLFSFFFVLSSYEEARASLLAAEDLAGWQSWQSHAAHRLRGPSDHKPVLQFSKFLDEGEKKSDASQTPKNILEI